MNAGTSPGVGSVTVGGFRVDLHPLPEHSPPGPVNPAAGAVDAHVSSVPEPSGDRWYSVARDRASKIWARVQEWASDLCLVPGTTLKRGEYSRWQQTDSLQGLCDLTTSWLMGEIDSQPGYYGRVDVDEDEAPGLTAALIALNKAGFLTRQSQAGSDGLGFDGQHWSQVAAVEGYASRRVIERLQAALTGTRYRIHRRDARTGHAPGITVTHRAGKPFTVFGSTSPDLVDDELEGCSAQARDEVRDACIILIWDPAVGRNDLWQALTDAATSPEGTRS